MPTSLLGGEWSDAGAEQVLQKQAVCRRGHETDSQGSGGRGEEARGRLQGRGRAGWKHRREGLAAALTPPSLSGQRVA